VPYVVSILVVSVADTSAALIGAAYGRHHFRGALGGKTVEGSTAFFLTSFLCVHVPLILWTDAGGPESLLIGLNLALILMLAEAVARRGTDNLLLPVLTLVLLNVFLEMPALDLIVHLLAILCLSLLGSLWRFRSVLFRDLMAPGVFK
jgi:phytol kinase